MALDEETDIMREIGLGPQHYTWHNGSGSCGGVRRQAAEKLPAALRAHGMKVSAKLCRLVKDVAERGEDPEMGQYVLTNTWIVASDVIRAHMERRHMTAARWKEYEAEVLRLHVGKVRGPRQIITPDGMVYLP